MIRLTTIAIFCMLTLIVACSEQEPISTDGEIDETALLAPDAVIPDQLNPNSDIILVETLLKNKWKYTGKIITVLGYLNYWEDNLFEEDIAIISAHKNIRDITHPNLAGTWRSPNLLKIIGEISDVNVISGEINPPQKNQLHTFEIKFIVERDFKFHAEFYASLQDRIVLSLEPNLPYFHHEGCPHIKLSEIPAELWNRITIQEARQQNFQPCGFFN
ncbi:MAG: hypothetical protein OXH39_12900 [Candidatus Poribacteria bacterium]|nr:hypothetical protein [Candidatus Poribacteria bacterium]